MGCPLLDSRNLTSALVIVLLSSGPISLLGQAVVGKSLGSGTGPRADGSRQGTAADSRSDSMVAGESCSRRGRRVGSEEDLQLEPRQQAPLLKRMWQNSQVDASPDTRPAPTQPPGSGSKGRPLRWLDFGLEHRSRYEAYDKNFRKDLPGSDQQLAQRTRVWVGVNTHNRPLGFLVELEDARVHATDARFRTNSSYVNTLDFLQMRLDINLQNLLAGGPPASIEVGRLTMDFGNRRLIARNRFRNTTNTFDGVLWSLGKEDSRQLRGFAVKPVRRETHRLDRFDPPTWFWGLEAGDHRRSAFRIEIYYFGLHGRTPNSDLIRRFTTLGGRLFKDPALGAFHYEVESAWQFGENASLDHFAHFQHLQGGYTFRSNWVPVLEGLFDYASGDRDPTDSKSGQFVPLFGSRRSELGPTGIWGPFSRSNSLGPGYRLTLSPSKNVRVGAAHRAWWLAQARDEWVGSGFRDPEGQSGRFLGNQVESWVQWLASDHLLFETGVAHLQKGRFARSLPDSPTNHSTYFYAATELHF
ncbi:MAG: alginate export family protein [Acidobacteriota bacterium]